MNRKLFLLLVILMSLSLIGIIFVQGYWIKKTVESKEEQFSFNARQIIRLVANEVQNNELESYYFALQEIVDSLGVEPDSSILTKIFETKRAEVSDELYLRSRGIFEEDYRLSTAFLDAAIDTVQFKRLINKRHREFVEQEDPKAALEKFNRIFRMNDVEKEYIRSFVMGETAKLPIHTRVSESTIERVISRELESRGLDSDFEYGIYDKGLATNVRSDNFELDSSGTYRGPIFEDEEGGSDYELFVNFTGKKQVVLSSIILMAGLSIVFTLIIVIAYSSALSQLIRQRQISEIKTDFINNMTHEFKTPIATINLALDAIKNPKIRGNQDKVSYYHKLIRDENRRMHTQVENVLRISRLENNELDLKKERLDLHELVDSAISHVELILQDREGYIKTHLGALDYFVLGNRSHLTNVLINLLDNALKYSEENPQIDIYTESAKDTIILKIRDQGIGMTKQVQRRVFDKFYREHTGDIHNVKGHGLGLAYVKRILDDHHGTIQVVSEKGKGSTFIIKLPLIS